MKVEDSENVIVYRKASQVAEILRKHMIKPFEVYGPYYYSKIQVYLHPSAWWKRLDFLDFFSKIAFNIEVFDWVKDTFRVEITVDNPLFLKFAEVSGNHIEKELGFQVVVIKDYLNIEQEKEVKK